jgi:hypothetical protein
MQAGAVVVEEASQAGSVPNLLVENRGPRRVLFLEGEQLIGAKQNRVLNTSILLAAGSKTRIPVSCVEQGRWAYRSRHFEHSGSHGSAKLRKELKSSVAVSLACGDGHRSDQSAVWAEVARQSQALHSLSPTMSMYDTYQAYSQRLQEFQGRLRPVEGASGLAVAVGNTVVALDLFDSPATCAKVWRRLLTGYVMDALEARPQDDAADQQSVEKFYQAMRSAAWQPTPSVGEGEEHHTQPQGGIVASALVCEGVLVHGSGVAA